MPTADDMMTFHAVAKTRSLSEAARQLGVRKQSVSQRVAKIEQELGLELVRRHNLGVELTEAGALFAHHCEAVAGAVRDGAAEVLGLKQEVAGELRVTVPVLMGRTLLMPTLACLMAEHPKLTVDVVLLDRAVDLIAEGFDLAVRVGKLTDSAVVVRRVGSALTHYVASPSWLDAHPEVTPRLLTESAHAIVHDGHDEWTIRQQAVRVQPRVKVNDLDTACEAALAGIGVAQLPQMMHQAHVDAGRLVLLFDGEPAARRDIYLVMPGRRHQPAKVRAFIDAMTTTLASSFSSRADEWF